MLESIVLITGSVPIFHKFSGSESILFVCLPPTLFKPFKLENIVSYYKKAYLFILFLDFQQH